jgi:hypothetical protein
MVFGFFGISVRYTVKTDYDTENRTSEIQKPKPNRTTEKTEISVRFGTVRFGFRFMVKKCPPLFQTISNYLDLVSGGFREPSKRFFEY